MTVQQQRSTKRGFTRCGEITKQLGNRCFSTVAVERDCLSNELRIRSPLGLLPDQIYIYIYIKQKEKKKKKEKVRRIIDTRCCWAMKPIPINGFVSRKKRALRKWSEKELRKGEIANRKIRDTSINVIISPFCLDITANPPRCSR